MGPLALVTKRVINEILILSKVHIEERGGRREKVDLNLLHPNVRGHLSPWINFHMG
jgi:hypothetical protein